MFGAVFAPPSGGGSSILTVKSRIRAWLLKAAEPGRLGAPDRLAGLRLFSDLPDEPFELLLVESELDPRPRRFSRYYTYLPFRIN